MRTLDTWLREYSESHQHPVNQSLHHLCVPLIVFSILGLLWLVPGESYPGLPHFINLATLLVVSVIPYYFVLSRIVAMGMLAMSLFMLSLIGWLDHAGMPLTQISISVFIAAWIGQFIGHQVEGRKPSFLKNIQFLLIGPVWVIVHFYNRLGIVWRK